jgi:Na+-transporting methylmalonyl-CoA/oxaloacetate decarboxylase gamma subunit
VYEAISIIGQAVLVVMGLVLLAFLLLLLLALIRAMRRLMREIRTPLLPESDLYIPEPFDQP